MSKKLSSIYSQISDDSIFTIGSVFSVKGKNILIKVNKDKNLPHLLFKGRAIKNVSAGLSNYVKILKGFTTIICKIEGEYLEENKYQSNKEYSSEKQRIDRFLNISVFGFYDHNEEFQHGIKEMPLIGSECRLLSGDEFDKLHKLSKEKELSITLGSLVDEETKEISLSVNDLFAGHIGIFGNTGSGKSNTLAKMYTELFNLENINDGNFKDKSKFIFIDFNGEYSKNEDDCNILAKNKKVYRLSTRKNDDKNKYPLLKDDIEKLELLSILLDATEKTQQPFLNRVIGSNWFEQDNDNYEKEIKSINDNLKTILTIQDQKFNMPFLEEYINDIEGLGFTIRNNNGKNGSDLKYHSGTDQKCFTLNIKRHTYFSDGHPEIKRHTYFSNGHPEKFLGEDRYFHPRAPKNLEYFPKIKFKILNQYYYEILKGYIEQEHIKPLIARMEKRFGMLDKVFKIVEKNSDNLIEVIDLKNVNLEIKKTIPLLICKANYDKQKNKRDDDKDNSLHIIIDEAHNILSEHSSRESESWKDYRLETFEEIIKEGRKFGIFLTIASQRPNDISPTIISQLHNYFIHKLMNDNDLAAINKAVSYLDKLSFDSISNLSVGCCFIAGQMTQFPLSVKIEILDEKIRPQSETIDLNKLWNSSIENENEINAKK